MDIEEFVRQTIGQITRGVLAAHADVGATGVLINPTHVGVSRHDGIALYRAYDKATSVTHGRLIEMIDFDLAVIVSDESGAKGKGGLQIASLVGIGGEKSTSSSSRSESRIRFKIPVALPQPGGPAGPPPPRPRLGAQTS